MSFSEHTMWKYFDTFFYIGAIAIRHEQIPSIRFHIKFDMAELRKAEEQMTPLVFKKVFVEECPNYSKY